MRYRETSWGSGLHAAPILVTGGYGFVGSRLCTRLIADGQEVVVLDNGSLGTPAHLAPAIGEQVHIAAVDIRDAEALYRCIAEYRPRTVFHLAAIHFIPTCNAHPLRAIEVNVAGTQAVLDACAAAPGVASVILASSAAVYAPSDAPLHEGSVLGPLDIYGHTKLWTEQLGALWHRRTGIPVGVARFFNIFGPGETNPHLIPEIIAGGRAGDVRLGNLTSRRDYVYVDDIVRGLALLAEACPTHGSLTCNFGSERAVDGWHLVRLVEELLGTTFTVTQDPAKLRPSDNPVILSDCTRAHDLLGWRAETTLEAGLTEAIRHPRAAGLVAPA